MTTSSSAVLPPPAPPETPDLETSPNQGSIPSAVIAVATARLLERHGDGEAGRIAGGIEQVRRLWRAEDGDSETFQNFVENEFVPSGPGLDETFERLEFAIERLRGYLTSLIRDLRRGADVDVGPLLAIDRRLAGYNPAAHLTDDLFANKIAFVVLLNFPQSPLEERLREGYGWSRRRWAEMRLAEGFASRLPAEVQQAMTAARSTSSNYISSYNIYLHHVLTADGRRLFEPGKRLLSHWGLRDEIKALYSVPLGGFKGGRDSVSPPRSPQGDGDTDPLERQLFIQDLFGRIVRQEIPAAVIDNPQLDWTPSTGAVRRSPVADCEAPPGRTDEGDASREDDKRYRLWIENFKAQQLADPYRPDYPTYIRRSFELGREIPEEEVRELFEAVLASPLDAPVARLVSERLGRDLEPFDIWYTGFKPRVDFSAAELDQRVRQRYQDAASFGADIPRLLERIGFSPERARFVAERVVVEKARGAGHAYGSSRPDDHVLLRTRIQDGGMDFQGYNTALHELGHNVEQVFSRAAIDHSLLQGVPNTAFTEAIAFVFQNKDLELLDVAPPNDQSAHMNALSTFWATREIAAVALVDMASWHWLYEHPEATPAEFRDAVLGISRDLWNRYFAPIFGHRDVTLLAVYSHMINRSLYTPDYPLGHIIAFQIEEYLDAFEGPLGDEIERICRIGNLTPGAWMREALDSPLSTEALLKAAAKGLEVLSPRGEIPS